MQCNEKKIIMKYIHLKWLVSNYTFNKKISVYHGLLYWQTKSLINHITQIAQYIWSTLSVMKYIWEIWYNIWISFCIVWYGINHLLCITSCVFSFLSLMLPIEWIADFRVLAKFCEIELIHGIRLIILSFWKLAQTRQWYCHTKVGNDPVTEK